MQNNGYALAGLLVVVLIIALIVIGPLVTIFCIRHLMPNVGCEYSFTNWFCVVLLGMIAKSKFSIKK